MPTALFVSLLDAGGDLRLLRHAMSFAKLPNSHVHFAGPQRTAVPVDVQNQSNIKFYDLPPFSSFSLIYSLALYPLLILYNFFNLLILSLRIKDLTHIFVTNNPSIISPIVGLLLSKIRGVMLIYDTNPFKKKKRTNLLSIFENVCIKNSDVIVVPSKSIQTVLKLRKIESVVIKDESARVFRGPVDSKALKEELGLDLESPLVCVPLFDLERLPLLSNTLQSFDQNSVKLSLVIFTKLNDMRTVKSHFATFQYFNVTLKLLPVNTETYSKCLKVSQLGVSLRGSNTNLDIAPEITDMAYSHLPIACHMNGAVHEWIKDKETGFLFRTEEDLYDILWRAFVSKSLNLSEMREKCSNQVRSWDDTWSEVMSKFVSHKKTD